MAVLHTKAIFRNGSNSSIAESLLLEKSAFKDGVCNYSGATKTPLITIEKSHLQDFFLVQYKANCSLENDIGLSNMRKMDMMAFRKCTFNW